MSSSLKRNDLAFAEDGGEGRRSNNTQDWGHCRCSSDHRAGSVRYSSGICLCESVRHGCRKDIGDGGRSRGSGVGLRRGDTDDRRCRRSYLGVECLKQVELDPEMSEF